MSASSTTATYQCSSGCCLPMLWRFSGKQSLLVWQTLSGSWHSVCHHRKPHVHWPAAVSPACHLPGRQLALAWGDAKLVLTNLVSVEIVSALRHKSDFVYVHFCCVQGRLCHRQVTQHSSSASQASSVMIAAQIQDCPMQFPQQARLRMLSACCDTQL